ncbi:hypothetical protein GGR56DRAFT_669389 [Xylariaceae sp. FL0804]|nr:hypothetical protein GGR56DRAFT_669389 [Xylariaceae sp. FL0804]
MAAAPGSDQGSSLAAMNSATLGAKFPEVQTGTIATLLVNVRAYNEAHAAGDAAAVAGLEDRFRASLPLLDRVGLFGLFTPDEWVQGSNEGRRAVGRLYLESQRGGSSSRRPEQRGL